MIISNEKLTIIMFICDCSAKILYVSGRLHPVDTYFTNEPQADYLDAVLVSIFQIHTKNPHGDILVFLPGKRYSQLSQLPYIFSLPLNGVFFVLHA